MRQPLFVLDEGGGRMYKPMNTSLLSTHIIQGVHRYMIPSNESKKACVPAEGGTYAIHSTPWTIRQQACKKLAAYGNPILILTRACIDECRV